MSNDTPLYDRVLFQDLNIDRNRFLQGPEYEETYQRLVTAGKAMLGKVGDFTGMNICIYVGSRYVLLGIDHIKHRQVENKLKAYSQFERIDPSIILASAALYHIIQKMTEKLEEEYEQTKDEEGKRKKRDALDKLRHVRKRFDDMNWLIGADGMDRLGMKSEVGSR